MREQKLLIGIPLPKEYLDIALKKQLEKIYISSLFQTLFAKKAKARIDESLKTFAETGTGYYTVGEVELVGRRKDGSEFPAKLTISPIKLDGNWNAVGLVKDMTNRKQIDLKMTEAEQRYDALFDQAQLGVLLVDPKTAAFIEFNDIAHLQLDYSREDFKKLTVFDIRSVRNQPKRRSCI